MGQILSLESNLTLKVKVNHHPHPPEKTKNKKTIGILTMVFYTYGQNLVILAWMGPKLASGKKRWTNKPSVWAEGKLLMPGNGDT